MQAIIKTSFLIFISMSLSAQNRQIKFKHLLVEDGLSNTSVSCITQDSMGFMWIGTVDGLNKYDGYKFTVYRNDKKDSTTISNNEIWVVFEDRFKNLWIGTRGGGLNRYIRETDSFIAYKYDENDTNSLSGNIIRAIYEDRNGRLWIGTRNGLNLFNHETGNFTRYLHNENEPNSLSHNYVIGIYEDSKDNFWISTHGGGLNLFNIETEKFTHFKHNPEDKNSISNDNLWYISEDNEGNLWVPTNTGIDRVDLSSKQVIFEHYIHNESIPQSLSKGTISMIYTDDQNRVWIAAETGLDLYDKNNDSFIHYKHNDFNKNSLSDNQIWYIYQDRTGLLWFGTHWGGINIFNALHNSFEHFEYNKNNPTGLSEKSILAFYEDKDSSVWIGVDHGGLNLFNKEENTFKHFMNDLENPNSISSNAVLSIEEDSYGYLWIGTWGGGVNRFDRKTQKIKRYLPDANDPGSLCDLNVYAILEDSRKNFWIGTHDCGLHLLNRADDSFTHFYPDNPDTTALSSGRIWDIFEDSKENLWIGTTDGLNLFDRDNKKFKVFRNNKNDPNSLSHNAVHTIFEDSKGRLWFGTSGGFCLYDYKKQSFKTYNTKHGLPSDMVGSILEDDGGNLWVGTFNGLSKFTPETESFQNYGKQEGLLSNQINLRSCLRSSTGEFYFGSPDGFTTFSPEDVQTNEHIPPIIATDFQLFNKPVKIGADSPLKKHISVTDEIILSHKDYVFSFEFSALDYSAPDNNQYRYILENFENEWNYNSAKDRSATYTNLSSGTYNLRIQGSNNDGMWNNEGTSVRIIVLPPWWHTWWAYTIYAVLFSSGIWAFISLRLRQARKHKLLLEKQVEQRTMELKESQDIAKIGKWVHHIKTNKLEWSGKIYDIFEIDHEGFDLSYEAFLDVIHPDDRDDVNTAYSNSLIAKTPYSITHRLLMKDGRVKYLVENCRTEFDENGNPIQSIGTVQDITSLKKVEEKLKKALNKLQETQSQLIHSEKMAALGQLTAGIAHEINNPINFVKSGSYALKQDFNDLEKLLELFLNNAPVEEIDKFKSEIDIESMLTNIPVTVEIIQSGVDRTSNIVKGLRSFSQIDNSDLSMVNINECLENTLILFSGDDSKNIELIKKYQDDIKPIMCYPSQLNQAFLQIINNARNAMKAGGKLTITTTQNKDHSTISFKDTGIGIPVDIKDKVFDPFFTTKNVGEGAGLGLAIVHGIIQKHNGKIEVKSEEGKGSEFIIELPMRK